jgi:hypothetical protein
MANYYVPTAGDIYKMTKTGKASFLGWEDYQLYQTKAGWEALGVSLGRLSSRMIYDHTTGNEYLVPQLMNMVEFDYTQDKFQDLVSNFLHYPASLHEILDKYFENQESTGRKKQGPMQEVHGKTS